MGYVRIVIQLTGGGERSGVRKFVDPMNPVDIRNQARRLAEEVLGRGAVEDVIVTELAASDPAVVALILHEKKLNKPVPRSDGTHPYRKEQGRKPER